MAGTTVVRTTNVSSSTPNATANPICKSPRILALIIAANVPAMMIPAEVMMPPVFASATWVPSLVPRFAASSFTRPMRKML